MEHESDDDTNCNWCARHSHQRIGIGISGIGNKRMNEGPPNYSFIKVGQNTEKSPGDLRKFVITQTAVEEHQ